MEIDGGAWGLIVIIAFLLGMGTPYPKRRQDRRNGGERREGSKSQLDQIQDMLELMIFQHRPPEPDNGNGPENGSD